MRRWRSASSRSGPGRAARAAALAIALAATALPSGCGRRPFAEGSSRDLTIITDLPPNSPEVLVLRAIVEREALRIDQERAYVVHLARPDDARAYRGVNVIVAGFGPAERIPSHASLLREAWRKRARSGRPEAFVPDAWGRGQAAGIVWTEDRASWLPAVTEAQNRIFLELDRTTFAAVRERVGAIPRDPAAERMLADSLGFTLRIPRGWQVLARRDSAAALLLEDGPPARLLRVRRIGAAGTAYPASTAMDRASRDRLARLFRPDERTLGLIEPTLVPDEMAGVVRQMHGRWEDERVSAAGPFRYYVVGRGPARYEIDLAVFAPGRPKLPYLRELQAIAETIGSP
jgi:hypothetical protein